MCTLFYRAMMKGLHSNFVCFNQSASPRVCWQSKVFRPVNFIVTVEVNTKYREPVIHINKTIPTENWSEKAGIYVSNIPRALWRRLCSGETKPRNAHEHLFGAKPPSRFRAWSRLDITDIKTHFTYNKVTTILLSNEIKAYQPTCNPGVSDRHSDSSVAFYLIVAAHLMLHGNLINSQSGSSVAFYLIVAAHLI